jgi:hypothetical protein
MFVLDVAGALWKTNKSSVTSKSSLQHSHIWLLGSKELWQLSPWQRTWVTFGKLLSAVGTQDPAIAGMLWDVLLSGVTLSIWAYSRNIQVDSILGCVSLVPWNAGSTLSTQSNSKTESKKGRGRPRRRGHSVPDNSFDENALSEYVATKATGRQEEEITGSGAVAWILFVIGGLGTAMSAVFGGELSGS